MTFWILLVCLTVLAVALIVFPLLMAGRKTGPNSEHEAQLAVLRDRRDEIGRDLSAGRLTPAEAESAQQELVDALAESIATNATDVAANTSQAGRSRTATFAALALAVLVPTGSYLSYALVGQPTVGAYLAENELGQQATAAQVGDMIDEIVARTQSHPNDGEAWLALAQARKIQGNLPASVAAFERAVAVGSPNAGVMADYAEAIALTQERNFSGRPLVILEQAFALDPTHVKVNALLGASYFQNGQRQKAVPFLKRFIAQIDPTSEQAIQINRLIESIKPGSTPPQGGGAAKSAALVSGTVTLTEGAAQAGATLFISARTPTGSRMPYAAIRMPADQFPVRFELSDANAMSAARKLSSAGEVVVEARISQSGQAMRQSGDRFGVSEVVKPGQAAVTIQIDQRVP